jgi:hypothetical protein
MSQEAALEAQLDTKLHKVLHMVTPKRREKVKASIKINMFMRGLFTLLEDAPFNGLVDEDGWLYLYATLLQYHQLAPVNPENQTELVPSDFHELVHRCRLLWLAAGPVRIGMLDGTKRVSGL